MKLVFTCSLFILSCVFVRIGVSQTQGCEDILLSVYCRIYRSRNLCNSPTSSIRNYLQNNCRQTCEFCNGPGSIGPNNYYQWSPWSQYSQCTRTCGGGRQRRTRYCVGATSYRQCPGSRVYVRACATNACQSLSWSNWTPHGDCSVTCGGGFQEERRECLHGVGCPGDGSRKSLQCNEQKCPEWSEWALYGSCSVTCGEGKQEERRSCDGGSGCEGSSNRTVLVCNAVPCPTVKPWSSWSSCSAKCGSGYQTRKRECGANCTEFDHQKCNVPNDCACEKCCSDSKLYASLCRRAGRTWCSFGFLANVCKKSCNRCPKTCPGCAPAYAKWSEWGACTVSCGGGLKWRFRNCNKKRGCGGLYYENATCAKDACQASDDPTWGPWQKVGNCSVRCGGGVRTETRECRNGTGCEGFSSKEVQCNTEPCEMGTWSSWTSNEACSKSCGRGKRQETRTCKNGSGCPGINTTTVDCNTHTCPTWGAWKRDGSCTVTCGGGKRRETRICINGSGCVGNATRYLLCNSQPCPYWGNWTDDGSCSATCGSGTLQQSRICVNAPGCLGRRKRTINCNQGNCSEPVWGEWVNNGACSVTCGGGTLSQTRTCKNGPGCQGQNRREVACNEKSCPEWAEWTDDGTCSVTCGGGTKSQRRTCRNGPGCKGPKSRETSCNEKACPEWSKWKSEGSCNATCGGGKQTQTRSCQNGPGCVGSATRLVNCNTQPCSTWSQWIPQGSCSASCGGGTQMETRTCMSGPGCQGNSSKTVACNVHDCIEVSFEWSDWSEWSNCPVTCGRGTKRRSRGCVSGTCVGELREEDTCTVEQVCPCTCSSISSCVDEFPDSCRNVRKSDCGYVVLYQKHCKKACGLCTCDPCGTWGAWKDITECTEVCGGGKITRERECPEGKTCNGPIIDIFGCNLRSCDQPHWTKWTEWSECPVSCDGGQQIRRRNCSVADTTKCGLSSSLVETKSCNNLPCNASWSGWTNWEECSITCGAGVQSRYRNCSGNLCAGSNSEERACNLKTCSLSYSWSTCSRSCGSGTRVRRVCRGGTCETEYDDCGSACAKASCSFPMFNRYGSRSYECCKREKTTSHSCGVSTIVHGRIINGVDSIIKQWPWMVLIRTDQDELCGGTLISRFMVITAAHCVRGKSTNSLTLRLGAFQFDDRNVHVQVRGVAQIFIHPQFNFPLHDIAILQLSEPAIIGGAYVRTLCLPQNEEVPNDTTCVAAGWGLTQPRTNYDASVADVLQEVELRVLNFDVCIKGYRHNQNYISKMRGDSMICAGRVLGGVDTCNGDSGGPLMCQRCSSCAWFLHGLTSFGSVDCGQSRKPGVYTKLGRYTDFINDVAQQIYNILPPGQRRNDELNIANGNFSSCN